MVIRPPLSVVIITLNEEESIARCLSSLSWAEEVLVVDSGSVDRTVEIAKEHGAKVLVHAWEGYGQQKNWGIAQASHDWVLSVDADEELSSDLQVEIQGFLKTDGWVGEKRYLGANFPRKTKFLSKWIMHGGWYPNRLVRLANRKHSRWTEPSVHESWQVNGPIYFMKHDLYHYTFRNVGDQVSTNVRFSRLGAKVAKQRGERGSLWKILSKPIGKFLETYFWKRGFLDGLPGFVISVNAAHSIFMKYVELRYEKNSDH